MLNGAHMPALEARQMLLRGFTTVRDLEPASVEWR